MRARENAPSFYQPYIGKMFMYDGTTNSERTCILSNILMDDSGEHYEEVTYSVVNNISFNMTPFKTIVFYIGGDFFRGSGSSGVWANYDFSVDFYRPGRVRIPFATQTFRNVGGGYDRVVVNIDSINEQAYFNYRFKGVSSLNNTGSRPYVAGVNRIDILN